MTPRGRGGNVTTGVERRTQHKYIPATDAEREEMLRTIGAASVEELFADIPSRVRLDRPLRLPRALSDPALMAQLRASADAELHGDPEVCFRRAGDAYRCVAELVW